MAIEYVNHQGQRYYLHQGRTKTGKPKYSFSTKAKGSLAETIPDGYEVYERHNGQVYLRKSVPRLITQAELELMEQGLRTLAQLRHFKLDGKKDVLTVYAPVQSAAELVRLYAPLAERTLREQEVEKFIRFEGTLQFVLVDKQQRLFAVNRYCYRGSVDDWRRISGAKPLDQQMEQYLPHIGKESYDEL